MIIIFFIVPVLFYFISEIVAAIVYGNLHYIRGKGIEMLEKELSVSSEVTCDMGMLALMSNSELKGCLIAEQPTSLLFPYYLESSEGITYGVLIFSKAYWRIKEKMKKLDTRVKF